ncbi:MAG TPA: dehypoxanthine futalosine cyclase [Granulicella sp.]
MALTTEQALSLCASDDLIGIGMEADALRRTLHPEGVVTYTVDRALTLPESGLLDEAFDGILLAAIDDGATALALSTPSSLTLEAVEQLLTAIRNRYPSLILHGFSATAVSLLAANSGLPVSEVLRRLQAAGLASLTGGDAGILDDALAQTRCSASEWRAIHRASHALGIPSTASIRFGAGETDAQIVAHLEALEQLQQETGGFTAFLPTVFTAPTLRVLDEATAVEYLRTLALARLVLASIPHIQVDWAAQGLKLAQMALRFGADDLGTALPATSSDRSTEQDLRRIIRGAGFLPVRRDAAFRTYALD